MSENYWRVRFEILGAASALCWMIEECKKHPDAKCSDLKGKAEGMLKKIEKSVGSDFNKSLDLWLHNTQAGK